MIIYKNVKINSLNISNFKKHQFCNFFIYICQSENVLKKSNFRLNIYEKHYGIIQCQIIYYQKIFTFILEE